MHNELFQLDFYFICKEYVEVFWNLYIFYLTQNQSNAQYVIVYQYPLKNSKVLYRDEYNFDCVNLKFFES
jgi:hypothetical protein